MGITLLFVAQAARKREMVAPSLGARPTASSGREDARAEASRLRAQVENLSEYRDALVTQLGQQHDELETQQLQVEMGRLLLQRTLLEAQHANHERDQLRRELQAAHGKLAKVEAAFGGLARSIIHDDGDEEEDDELATRGAVTGAALHAVRGPPPPEQRPSRSSSRVLSPSRPPGRAAVPIPTVPRVHMSGGHPVHLHSPEALGAAGSPPPAACASGAASSAAIDAQDAFAARATSAPADVRAHADAEHALPLAPAVDGPRPATSGGAHHSGLGDVMPSELGGPSLSPFGMYVALSRREEREAQRVRAHARGGSQWWPARADSAEGSALEAELSRLSSAPHRAFLPSGPKLSAPRVLSNDALRQRLVQQLSELDAGSSLASPSAHAESVGRAASAMDAGGADDRQLLAVEAEGSAATAAQQPSFVRLVANELIPLAATPGEGTVPLPTWPPLQRLIEPYLQPPAPSRATSVGPSLQPSRVGSAHLTRASAEAGTHGVVAARLSRQKTRSASRAVRPPVVSPLDALRPATAGALPPPMAPARGRARLFSSAAAARAAAGARESNIVPRERWVSGVPAPPLTPSVIPDGLAGDPSAVGPRGSVVRLAHRCPALGGQLGQHSEPAREPSRPGRPPSGARSAIAPLRRPSTGPAGGRAAGPWAPVDLSSHELGGFAPVPPDVDAAFYE